MKYVISKSKGFEELSLDEYRSSLPLFAKDVYIITAEVSIVARNVIGGTAPEQVIAALAQARKLIGVENEKQAN